MSAPATFAREIAATYPECDGPAVVFQNAGLIDLAAVTTMGVSVKDGDGPIGYFGTGLKFAIATILRDGGSVVLFRGQEPHFFTARTITVRGQEFQQVCMNDHALGFTTQLGRNWEAWMAFRELASNCRDEGGRYFADKGDWSPMDGHTTIVAYSEKIAEAYRSRANILLESEPLFANDFIEIHEGPSAHAFYRGVRIHETWKPTALRYNIKRKIDLTEDRTAKYNFQVNDAIRDGLLDSSEGDLLRRALTCGDRFLEHDLDFGTDTVKPTEEFVRLGTTLSMDAEQVLTANPSVVRTARNRALKAMRPGDGMVLGEREEKMLDRAVRMLAAGGFDPNAFPVVCVDTLGPGTHGLAKDGKIFMSRLAFDKGTREVAATLLEEYAHLRSGMPDCSRGFQNWLFDQLLVQVEVRAGEPF